jgi:hypothetical protein
MEVEFADDPHEYLVDGISLLLTLFQGSFHCERDSPTE